jgi:hypothetical protein
MSPRQTKVWQVMVVFGRALSCGLIAIVIFAAFPMIFMLAAAILGDITGWYRLENYMTMSDH